LRLLSHATPGCSTASTELLPRRGGGGEEEGEEDTGHPPPPHAWRDFIVHDFAVVEIFFCLEWNINFSSEVIKADALITHTARRNLVRGDLKKKKKKKKLPQEL